MASSPVAKLINDLFLCSDLRKAVDRLVGRVNAKYGSADYCPVHYVKKKLEHV